MSWESKTDYCGLATTGITCKGATENRSGEFLEKLGQNGEIAFSKAFGDNAAPNNEYEITGDVTLSVALGGVTSITEGTGNDAVTKRYALQSVSFSSSAGSAPTLSATAQQIETTSNGRDNSFTPFPISVSPDDAAQNAADAFTLSGSDCELTQCGVEISCTVDPHRVNGLAVASDVHTGHVVVSVTVGQYGSTKPTLVAKSGWSLSAPLTCTDPDSDTPSWTATLTKPLTKVVATAST